MKLKKEFLAGYAAAISNLGGEGDYRGVDWSAAVEYLKERLGTFEEDVPPEITPTELNACANMLERSGFAGASELRLAANAIQRLMNAVPK